MAEVQLRHEIERYRLAARQGRGRPGDIDRQRWRAHKPRPPRAEPFRRLAQQHPFAARLLQHSVQFILIRGQG